MHPERRDSRILVTSSSDRSREGERRGALSERWEVEWTSDGKGEGSVDLFFLILRC